MLIQNSKFKTQNSEAYLLVIQTAKPFRGAFGRDVSLGLCQHLIADHELAHGCRTQQWRVEVGVQVPLRVGYPIRGALVKPHAVGKTDPEQPVVPARQASQNVGQSVALRWSKSGQSIMVLTGQDERLKGPDRPK